jgi:endonuclease/exonuclease/phosphatase (EEP) superfamily protein YafD
MSKPPAGPPAQPDTEKAAESNGPSAEAAETPRGRSRLSRVVRKAVGALSVAYVVAVVALWALLWLGGDRWWPATLLMYGPRWVYILPLAVLAPAALLWRRGRLPALAAAGLIVVGPIMGLCIPWRTWMGGPSPAEHPTLRVLSYNVKRFSPDPEAYQALLGRLKPDVIAIQEHAGWTRLRKQWELPASWHRRQAGEMMVASRHPILRVEVSRCDLAGGRPVINAMYCVIDTPDGKVGFCCLHLETPRRGLSLILNRGEIDLGKADAADRQTGLRREESVRLLRWLQRFDEPMIIAGDFNMTADSTIYRRTWSRYRNAFGWAGFGYGYTKQTAIRRRGYGLRIDHILTDENWVPVDCRVGPDLGSDHLPLIADLVRLPG